YVKQYTDLPFIITLDEEADGFSAGKFLRAEQLGMDISNAAWKTVVYDANRRDFAVPNGTIEHRWDENKTWNLELRDTDNGLEDIDPLLSFVDDFDDVKDVRFPEFLLNQKNIYTRKVPVKQMEIDGELRYVTTVFSLFMANCGVSRNLPGETPITYEDEEAPYTPAWQ